MVAIDLKKSYPELETFCIDLHSGAKCRLIVVYRAPNSDHMLRSLECMNALSNVDSHCVIAGDFNCNGIDWQTFKAPGDGIQDALLNFAIVRGFSQEAQSPTRGDLVFSNEPSAMYNVKVYYIRLVIVSSDHCQIKFTIFKRHAL